MSQSRAEAPPSLGHLMPISFLPHSTKPLLKLLQDGELSTYQPRLLQREAVRRWVKIKIEGRREENWHLLNDSSMLDKYFTHRPFSINLTTLRQVLSSQCH